MNIVRHVFFLSASLLAVAACGGPTTTDAGGSDGGGTDAAVALCAADRDCGDQSVFCAQWRCRPGESGTDARGCVDLGAPCEPGEGCDEENDRCGAPAWCTEGRDGCLLPGDCDGDGHKESLECGGDDCDDDDGDRHPGNTEVCDAAGHDEDCNPDTVAGDDDGDLDGDGYISAACCNGDTCGDDCDDSARDIYPGAREVCNAVDDDCDGRIDEAGAFCPSGICIDSRCRAETWARTFGGGSGHEAILSMDTDQDGNVYAVVLSTSPDYFNIGSETIRSGLSLISYSASGAFRWATQVAVYNSFDPVSLVYAASSSVAVGPSGELVAVRNLVDEGIPRSEIFRMDPHDGEVLSTSSHEPPAPWTFALVMYPVVAVPSGFILMGLVGDESTSQTYAEFHHWNGRPPVRRLFEIEASDAPTGISRFLKAHGDGVVFTHPVGSPLILDGVTVDVGAAIIEMNSSLEVVQSLSLPGEMQVASLATSPSDGMVVAGRYTGTVETPWGEVWPNAADERSFVFSLAADHTHRWTRRDPNASYVSAHFDGRGRVMVGGSFSDDLDLGVGRWASTGDCDAFTASFDVNSEVAVQGRSFVGTGCEEVTAAAVDAFGGVLIGGTFTDRITLGGSTYSSSYAGRADAFLVRVAD